MVEGADESERITYKQNKTHITLFLTCLLSVYENQEKIVLVMEYASGGELYDYIDDKKGLEDKEARKFFRQIVSAINYLHQVLKILLKNIYTSVLWMSKRKIPIRGNFI